MTIADHNIITQRYFFPRQQPLPGATMVDAGPSELACFFQDGGHDKTLVHFHGNGEIVSDHLPGFAQQLDKLGVNVFFAEYRGYGGSTGTPKLGAMLDDVAAIREAVGVADDQLFVFGRSIGSIYAIEFAARFPDIAGLILESGIADVRERIQLRATPEELGTTSEAMREEFERLFNHQKKLQSYQGRTLIMHAEHDHLVHKSHAEQNARWVAGETELTIFERGDHNSIFHANQVEYLKTLGAFLAR